MKLRRPQLLLHPVFLVSLFLLLINDLSLKYEFGNAFTGKLSDFTGLVVFSMVWIAFVPRRKSLILILTALMFSWWKSPLSENFIEFFNTLPLINIDRVVDYSDLWALTMLPVAHVSAVRNECTHTTVSPFLIRFVGITSLFAFCNTSAGYRTLYFEPDSQSYFGETINTDLTAEEVADKLAGERSAWKIDSVLYRKLRANRYYTRQVDPIDSMVSWQHIAHLDTAVYMQEKEAPFYLVDSVEINGEMLTGLRFRYYELGRKKKVNIISFAWQGHTGYLSRKDTKMFKRYFKKYLD